MNYYKIDGTKSSPEVVFEFDKGELTLSGKSFATNPFKFYQKLKKMFDLVKIDKLSITINIDYTNTVSSKNLLEVLKTAKSKFLNLSIVWMYDEDDQDLLDLGYTFYEILNVPVEFRSK